MHIESPTAQRRRHFVSGRALLVVLAMLAGGCGRAVNTQAWQKSVEAYAATHAGGDMNFLRDSRPGGPAGRPQFTIASDDMSRDSTDATGVVLGRKMIAGQPWYVFIVGLAKKQTVQDIRVSLLLDDASRNTWLWSAENSAALNAYKQHRDAAWRQRHSGRSSPPETALDFPSEADDFELAISGSTVEVVERGSGARWTLAVPPQQ